MRPGRSTTRLRVDPNVRTPNKGYLMVEFHRSAHSPLCSLLFHNKLSTFSIQPTPPIPNMTDYETRAKEFGFATKEEIQQAYQSPDTIVLDVRSPSEIETTMKKAVQTTCTPSGCEALAANPSQFVPDASATVIIFCRSGRRTCCYCNNASLTLRQVHPKPKPC